MKIDTSFDYKKIASQAVEFANKNRIIVVSILVLAVGAYAVNRISSLSQPELDTAHLKVKLGELKEVDFDEEAIQRIQSLNDSNIEIGSDFTDRNNPFGE